MSTQTNEKVYVNSLWFEEKNFDSGGSILKTTVLNVDELITFLKSNKDENGKVRLVIAKKKNIEPNKSTHYAYLDTWQPTNKTGPTSTKTVSKPTKKVSAPVEQEEELI